MINQDSFVKHMKEPQTKRLFVVGAFIWFWLAVFFFMDGPERPEINDQLLISDSVSEITETTLMSELPKGTLGHRLESDSTTTAPSTTIPKWKQKKEEAAKQAAQETVPKSTTAPPSVWTDNDAKIDTGGQHGSVRVVCLPTHTNNDDPLVAPGQQNGSHSHTFFGNPSVDFSFSPDRIRASEGNFSCQGGPLNKSAYWVPSVLDASSNIRMPQYSLMYYKRAGDEEVVPYPSNFTMIAGNASATEVQNSLPYAWYCGAPVGAAKHDVSRTIPNCEPGDFLTLTLKFPRCSNGLRTSADHKSHVAYPLENGQCPELHPVRHPEITYNIFWNNNDVNTSGWKLSSDHGSAPGGTTVHGDWINGWDNDTLIQMTTGCWNADHDCKGGTIDPTTRLVMPEGSERIYNATIPPVILSRE